MERELISYFRQKILPHPLLRLGPGDDAAVLRMATVDECVVTTDLLTDQVDFNLAEVDPRRVGRKAVAVNLSDLAAMAAKPLAAVVAVALPRHGGMNLATTLFEGMLSLAKQYDLPIAGGDTNSWDGPLVISATLLGQVTGPGPLCRSGAKPGDRILVTGAFGGSILGRHLDFEPRVHEAMALHAHYELHAGTDVSDGLSLDLAHIVEESHCGAILQANVVPLAVDAQRLAKQLDDGSTPLDHALADGEDFELILAVPPHTAEALLNKQPFDLPLTDIGYFVAEPGLWIRDADGRQRPLTPRGWEHTLT